MGKIATVVGGGTPSTRDAANYESGSVAWITPADLSGYHERYIRQGRRAITNIGLRSSSARLLPKGAVLFSSRAPIGYVAIAGQPLCTNQGFKSFVLPDGILPEYVYYFLQRARDHVIKNFASGTTFLEVSGKSATRIPVALCPPGEQRRIVAAIDALFSDLAVAESALDRVQANLKRYRAAVLQAAVSGRLVPTEAELARREGRDYEPASILLKRILEIRRHGWEEAASAEPRAQRKRLGDDPWKGRQRQLSPSDPCHQPHGPEGWCVVRLDSVSEVQLGQQRHPQYTSARARLPYVRAANITWKGLDLRDVREMGFPNAARYRLECGDLLLSEASGSPMEAGKPAIWRGEIAGACYQKTVLRVRVFDRTLVLPEFLRLVILRDCFAGKFAELAPGVGIVHITAERLNQWPVPLPPVADQQRIVDEVDRIETRVDEAAVQVLSQTGTLHGLRQAILRWAFDGILVNQDPADEPASVLLDRIRAEREDARTEPKAREPRTRRRKTA